MLSLTNNTFNQDGYWVKTIPDFEFSKHSIRGEFPIAAYVDIFDQNGYDLTYLEQMYASANYTVAEPHRYKKTLKQNWFTGWSVKPTHHVVWVGCKRPLF